MSYTTGKEMNAVGKMQNNTFGSKLTKQQSLFRVNHKVGLTGSLWMFVTRIESVIFYISMIEERK